MGTGGQGGLEAVGAGQGGSKSVMGVGVEAASHPPASGLFVRGQMHPNEPPPTHSLWSWLQGQKCLQLSAKGVRQRQALCLPRPTE